MSKGSEPGALDSGLRLRMRGEQRRIASQHRRLDELCDDVYTRIERNGGTGSVEAFRLFATALDAHMTVEEDIYFPALHGLRPEAGERLAGFVSDHGELRSEANAIEQQLAQGDDGGAIGALDRLAQRVTEHERAEEALIAHITAAPVRGDGRTDS